MSLSRRKFMKAGAVAAACVVLPVKSALGRNGLVASGASLSPLPQSSGVNPDQLGYYTESSFAPYVNTEFRVYLDASNTRVLKLVEVSDYLSTLSRSVVREDNSPRNECFSLLLTAPSGRSFEQDTYLVEHDALGTFYLFLVPVSAQGKAALDYYEAVVYRRPDNSQGSDASITGNSQPLGRGGAAIGAVGVLSGGRKTEQEVYYFRPQATTASSAVPVQPIPGAAGRRAASKLSVAQAPNIGGLKLGMTLEQVLAQFPGIRDDADVRASLSGPPSKFGDLRLIINPSKYASKSRFDRASQIIVTLVDGRVSAFYVGYDGPAWAHVDEFVAKFAAEAKLPGADSWDAYPGMDSQLKTLRCMGFEISIFAGSNNVNVNYIEMHDIAAQQRLRDRRAKARMLKGAKS